MFCGKELSLCFLEGFGLWNFLADNVFEEAEHELFSLLRMNSLNA